MRMFLILPLVVFFLGCGSGVDDTHRLSSIMTENHISGFRLYNVGNKIFVCDLDLTLQSCVQNLPLDNYLINYNAIGRIHVVLRDGVAKINSDEYRDTLIARANLISALEQAAYQIAKARLGMELNQAATIF